jgi:hypothetical protein
LTQRELNKATRKFGNQAAIEYRDAHAGISEQTARRAALEELRAALEAAIVFDSLPKDAPFKAFRIGWRGAYTINHGAPGGYSQGCRCDLCKEAWRVYQAGRYRKRRQALAAIKSGKANAPFVEGTRGLLDRAEALELERAVTAWIGSMGQAPHCKTCKCTTEADRLREVMNKARAKLAELGELE